MGQDSSNLAGPAKETPLFSTLEVHPTLMRAWSPPTIRTPRSGNTLTSSIGEYLLSLKKVGVIIRISNFLPSPCRGMIWHVSSDYHLGPSSCESP